MDDTESQATGILLPPARVAVFSRDAETLAAFASLKEDWRFSRVDVKVVDGDVDTAIRTFQTEGVSPDLVVIQTEDIEGGFTDKLGELSGYCNEGTSAIVIGPVNDVYLYRRLIEMGVSDYLVRPIKRDVVSQVLSKTLVTKLGVSGSKLVAFIGAKGGVGTSSLAQAAAWVGTELVGEKIMLLDAAGGTSALSVGLGFDPATTLGELVRAVDAKNEDSLKRMQLKITEKLSVLAGGGDSILDASITIEQFERVINRLMIKSPVVMVDLSGAPMPIKKLVMARANHIFLVTKPTLTSLRFARSLLKEIAEVRGGGKTEISLLVNKQGMSKAHEVQPSDIHDALEYKSAATIPFLPAVFLGAETDSKKFLAHKEITEVLKTLLVSVLKKTGGDGGDDNNSKKAGLIGGFLTKLTAK